MEAAIFALAAIFLIVVPVAAIWAFVWVFRLSGQVRRLETQVADLTLGIVSEQRLGDPSVAAPQDDAKPPEPAADLGEPIPRPETPAPKPVAEPARIPFPWEFDAADRAPARPVATGPTIVDGALSWLSANWFYAVAAASLALAGIFLVQYGMERGLLPPPLRVIAALAFGVALIACGEWIRRRFGDDEAASTVYLPSASGP